MTPPEPRPRTRRSPVDVEPHPLVATDLGDGGQVVDGAGAHRARRADHQERPAPRRAILGHRGPEGRDIEALVLVGPDPPEGVGAQSGDIRRLLDPGVGLGRPIGAERWRVAHTLLADLGTQPLRPRRQERHDVGQVAPAHEQSARGGREPDEVRDPAHGLRLDLGRHGRELPGPHVGVGRARQQLTQDSERRRAGRDVAHEARVPVEQRSGEQLVAGLVQHLVRRVAVLGEPVAGGQGVPDGLGCGRGV